ncbi:nucleic-acid-binding protein from mobile element jockey-like, partial [Vespula squamosa]
MASNNIPPIKITNNGGSFSIQQQSSDIESRQKRITKLARNPTMESEIEPDSESSQNWKPVNSSSKKRKVMKSKQLRRIDYDSEPQDKWLLDKISLTNSFDLLQAVGNSYTLKQLQNNQVKIQADITVYSKIVPALKEKKFQYYKLESFQT